MMSILQITSGKEQMPDGTAGKRAVVTLTVRCQDDNIGIGELTAQLIAMVHGANDAELAAKHPSPVQRDDLMETLREINRLPLEMEEMEEKNLHFLQQEVQRRAQERLKDHLEAARRADAARNANQQQNIAAPSPYAFDRHLHPEKFEGFDPDAPVAR